MESFMDYIWHPEISVPLGIGLGVYLFLWILKNIVVARLKVISEKTDTYVDDIILVTLDKTKQFFMVGVALYAGFKQSSWDVKRMAVNADRLLVIVVGIQVIVWGLQAIKSWFEFEIQKKNNDPAIRTTFGFLGILVKFLFLATVVLFALNNLGVDVTTFIAGLGVGGIAIALATQNILGDLFSSLSIVLDKPFLVGDFINLGEWMGNVEHIGLKTTRIRSLTGEQIIVSNSQLLSSKIRNHKRMTERRVLFQIGVVYETTREQLKLLPELIKSVVSVEEKVRFERAHFMRFGASSLDFEVVYWVKDPDYTVHMDLQQKILLGIHEEIEKSGMEFAYPTQVIFTKQVVSAT